MSQDRYAVIIDELMADPSPAIGLPANEWIELKNRSSVPIQLQGWRISDKTGISGGMPSYLLQPDSFIIVCATGSLAALSPLGNVVAVTSFPSLDNENDLLYLRTAEGMIMHAVEYNSSWYGNQLKKDGGWSLEMKDTDNPCSGINNWKASINNKGGTPGSINSLNGVNADQSPPRLKRSYTTDPQTVVLLFDEPVDSINGSNTTHYSIDHGITITTVKVLPPLFDQIELTLASAMQEGIVYIVAANAIVDCSGNSNSNDNIVKAGFASLVNNRDIIINEILFNPASGGYDYVELYNNSEKIIDASTLSIANRNSTHAISSITKLTTSAFYIFPGEYIVCTEDANNLGFYYLIKNPETVIELPAFPSLPDDKGSVLLLNTQGEIVDEVNYLDDWHFALVTQPEAVSLERIDPSGGSSDKNNWHSAASAAGYGTPGYKNSHYKEHQLVNAIITISPVVFSPDNDGIEDIAGIQYKFDETGYVANVIIFDAGGRFVRTLVRNELLSREGVWNWDGLGEKAARLPIGPYIIVTEIFNLQGKRRQFKNVITLAKRL